MACIAQRARSDWQELRSPVPRHRGPNIRSATNRSTNGVRHDIPTGLTTIAARYGASMPEETPPRRPESAVARRTRLLRMTRVTPSCARVNVRNRARPVAAREAVGCAPASRATRVRTAAALALPSTALAASSPIATLAAAVTTAAFTHHQLRCVSRVNSRLVQYQFGPMASQYHILDKGQ